MKYPLLFSILLVLVSCKKEAKKLTADEIVNKSIAVTGVDDHKNYDSHFEFRGIVYQSENRKGRTLYKRKILSDTATITDVFTNGNLKRYIGDSLLNLPDTTAQKYANSVNSVHYFARLPLALNDVAVKKELLSDATINAVPYHKIKITFSQENGGEDYDDVYVYWINKETLKPDFLAYEYHVDGGGQRFRVAFNERYVNGIRFVDYENYKPKISNTSILIIDSLYTNNYLELLSKIELENIKVTPSY
ncbi:hypothetical protein GCM10011414_15510 [Croceivirga lutea]|uniref:DUF6503 family protein n=1 Tax=Croceivirga lutea TaxID=1775167 RepID=UPI00163A9F87|nr:DUF6503 family protein [Croceivirga lutea]GGG46745.1 hypothetical protein GCM10011414_15510 [Croceivirga lutea]